MRQVSLIKKLQREGGGHTLRRHRNGTRGGDDAATGRGDGREALDGVEDDDGWMGTRRRRGRGGDGGRHGLDGERGKVRSARVGCRGWARVMNNSEYNTIYIPIVYSTHRVLNTIQRTGGAAPTHRIFTTTPTHTALKLVECRDRHRQHI